MDSWTVKLEHFTILGQREQVKKALAQGAAVNGSSKGLRTPLHNAAKNGDLVIVRLLCDHQANTRVRSLIDRGMQPLHLAVRNGHADVVKELLTRGADVNAAENKGLQAVHLAAVHGHKQVLEELGKRGCDLDSQNRDGATALHLAAENGHLEVVRWLVAQGASTDVMDNCLRTAKDCAVKKLHLDIAEFLHRYSNPPDQPHVHQGGTSQEEQEPPAATPAEHNPEACQLRKSEQQHLQQQEQQRIHQQSQQNPQPQQQIQRQQQQLNQPQKQQLQKQQHQQRPHQHQLQQSQQQQQIKQPQRRVHQQQRPQQQQQQIQQQQQSQEHPHQQQQEKQLHQQQQEQRYQQEKLHQQHTQQQQQEKQLHQQHTQQQLLKEPQQEEEQQLKQPQQEEQQPPQQQQQQQEQQLKQPQQDQRPPHQPQQPQQLQHEHPPQQLQHEHLPQQLQHEHLPQQLQHEHPPHQLQQQHSGLHQRPDTPPPPHQDAGHTQAEVTNQINHSHHQQNQKILEKPPLCQTNLDHGNNENNTEESPPERELLNRMLSESNEDNMEGVSETGSNDIFSDTTQEELLEEVSAGNYTATERLLTAGADPDTRSSKPGEKGLALLHLACWSGHDKILRLLLRYRADRKATAHGLQAVHWAAVGGHIPVLAVMWEKGFSIKVRSHDGATPLHLAADHGNLEAVRWFVEKGAYVNIMDKHGRTPKLVAKEAGHRAIVKYLQDKEDEMHLSNLQEQRKLGEGSFGEVILVRTSEGFMVVKRIDLSQLRRKHQEYAHREFQLLKSLCHPYIVAYRGGGFEGKHLHIHMEYCSGGDLATRIKEQKETDVPFEERLIHCWALSLCLALKYIHGRNILHRDLKPHNIFLTEGGTIKLGDFGLARVIGEAQHALTSLGSPAYMSPEVIRGEAYNAKADMWALGCCFYELATLERGFPYTEVSVSGGFSVEYKTMVVSLLQQDPDQRPSAALLLRQSFIMDAMENQLEEKEQEVTELSREVVQLNQETDELINELETLKRNIRPEERKPR